MILSCAARGAKKVGQHCSTSLTPTPLLSLTLDQLSVELDNYNVDVAIITETHLKKHHQSSLIKIDGYNIFRRDRLSRCRGGVAIFVRS